MKEHLYTLNDQQIIDSARAQTKNRDREPFVQNIRQEAQIQTRRVTTKAQHVAEGIFTRNKMLLDGLPEDQREQVSHDISELVKKRERSRAGLASYLIGKEHIRKEHVNDDGSLKIEELRETAYFQKNEHFLDALSAYQLSEKSKLRQKKKKREVEPKEIDQMAHPEITKKTGKKEKPLKKLVNKFKHRKETPHKKKKIVRTGVALAGLAMTGGLLFSCTSENTAEHPKPSATSTAESNHPSTKPSPEQSKPTEKPKQKSTPIKPVPPKHIYPHTMYKVERGDNLWNISEHFYKKGSEWKEIFKANKAQIKNPRFIYPKQELTIPIHKHNYKKNEQYTKQYSYKIHKGDNLSQLAEKFHTTVPNIMEKNKQIKNKNLIYINEKLIIPTNHHALTKKKSEYQKQNTYHEKMNPSSLKEKIRQRFGSEGLYIINHESSLNPHAVNPDGGACGLVQALPCSKLLHEIGNLNNVEGQLNWFQNYVDSRYGGVHGAYNFWQQNHWY